MESFGSGRRRRPTTNKQFLHRECVFALGTGLVALTCRTNKQDGSTEWCGLLFIRTTVNVLDFAAKEFRDGRCPAQAG
jgi:hypothetical protein